MISFSSDLWSNILFLYVLRPYFNVQFTSVLRTWNIMHMLMHIKMVLGNGDGFLVGYGIGNLI